MTLADTHCHLGRYHDRRRVLASARSAGTHVVAATARPSEAQLLAEAVRGVGGVDVGIGFHPESAGSVYNDHEFATLESVVDAFTWVSEIGLDGVIADSVGPDFGNAPTMAAQRSLLERVLHITGSGRGYSVHSRGAERETVAVLRAADVRWAIMHSFGGTSADLDAVLSAGYLVSVHPSMVETEAGRDVVRRLPSDVLLLESDGPYSTWNQQRIEPAHCAELITALSEIRSVPVGDLRDSISANFGRLAAQVRAANDRNVHAH